MIALICNSTNIGPTAAASFERMMDVMRARSRETNAFGRPIIDEIP